jgi:hypothetical protein
MTVIHAIRYESEAAACQVAEQMTRVAGCEALAVRSNGVCVEIEMVNPLLDGLSALLTRTGSALVALAGRLSELTQRPTASD